MAANTQLSFINAVEYNLACPITGVKPKKIKKKRVHFKVPTYIKKYSFYSENPYTNELQYLGDEKHIFRHAVLQRLHSILYGYCNVDIFEQFEKKNYNGLIIWGEDKQAEIADTWQLPLGDRVKIHLKLLRLLRNGFSVSESLERLKGEKNGKF
ncbi:hypothetical protein IKP85_06610 [bacterium]|nr:hypothetical protein [bacterium]